jgi:carbamoyl-phosphate synthase large subunit
VVQDGTVRAVVNTTSGGRAPMRDGFQIRRAAAERRIPCYTSLDTVNAAVRSIVNGAGSYSVLPITEYTKPAHR